MEPLAVLLDLIVADPRLQPRIEGIDPDHVRELEGVADSWPPLPVVQRGENYLLVDGFHRFAAAKHLGLEEVFVTILDVPDTDDLHALAFQLNAVHGRPLTLSDRRAHAARLLENQSEISDRRIGRQCGLAPATIAKIRQELERAAKISATFTREGRDGRSYPVSQGRSSSPRAFSDILDGVFTALDRTGYRRIAKYLQKLADLLEEQDDLDAFKTIDQAAQACRHVLGEEEAKLLADRLGWSSGNVLQIALALGYQEDSQS